jgi:hypothetical protein
MPALATARSVALEVRRLSIYTAARFLVVVKSATNLHPFTIATRLPFYPPIL